MKILVTGTAGFIGFHLAKRLLERGNEVIGLDCINDYYDKRVKYGRLEQMGLEVEGIRNERLSKSKFAIHSSKLFPNYKFVKMNLEDRENIQKLFDQEKFDEVVNLAAQAGVRYSIENPYAYIDSNIVGFINLLEACRHNDIKHFVYASSSSVYGLNEQMPFSTSSDVNHPMSLYAATKKSDELMAHTYSHLYNIPTTGLRFFTVYGPWGRPDMALFLFTKAALEGKPINVFNNGNMLRDFTYIDDIVEGVVKVLDNPAKPDDNWSGKNPDPSSSSAPYKIYNIGNNNPVKLMDFIQAIENTLGKNIEKHFMPLQAGDVPATYANADDLVRDFNYKPDTPIQEGIDNFIKWFKKFYKC